MQDETFAGEQKWGKGFYNTLTQVKAAIVLQLLTHGFTVLLCDSDIVFTKPGVVEYIQDRFLEDPRRLMVSSLETVSKSDPPLNSGFYAVKPHPFMFRVFEIITLNQILRPNTVDQVIFNEVVDAMGLKANAPRRHLIYYLDRLLFTNGKYYFRQRLCKHQGITPFSIHANYLTGRDGKELAFREFGLWYVPETGISEQVEAP